PRAPDRRRLEGPASARHHGQARAHARDHSDHGEAGAEMNVILREPVEKLGEAGDVVKVKDGYARNWLVPQGLALPATESNRAELQARLAQRARQLSERKSDAERLAEL